MSTRLDRASKVCEKEKISTDPIRVNSSRVGRIIRIVKPKDRTHDDRPGSPDRSGVEYLRRSEQQKSSSWSAEDPVVKLGMKARAEKKAYLA
jgi:hypothetical protein